MKRWKEISISFLQWHIMMIISSWNSTNGTNHMTMHPLAENRWNNITKYSLFNTQLNWLMISQFCLGKKNAYVFQCHSSLCKIKATSNGLIFRSDWNIPFRVTEMNLNVYLNSQLTHTKNWIDAVGKSTASINAKLSFLRLNMVLPPQTPVNCLFSYFYAILKSNGWGWTTGKTAARQIESISFLNFQK